MAEYWIVADVSKYLLEMVRAEVCPALLSAREMVALNAPGAEDNEALLNLYLYDLQEFSSYLPQRQIPPNGQAMEAPLAVTARYLVSFSDHAQNPADALLQQRVLGRVLQALRRIAQVDIAVVHDMANSGDAPAEISFSKLDNHEKQDLWNALSQPLRPAVYFEVGPLLIDGNPITVSRVSAAKAEVTP